eukprot:TRINITY_DN40989_c0_g1_i1.p1 TRINITY_DN40989_c0_g1~~TRINITY_DN40989_c0_g1_i1.p1  ORF type:complete len:601 (+),score=84.64 TRINITY_DN40989_c0_g1_i1:70-1872(+)
MSMPPPPPPPPAMHGPSSPTQLGGNTTAGLIRRCKDLGVEVPPGAGPVQLRALVEEAERQQFKLPTMPPASTFPGVHGFSTFSVAELKSRLRELGFEIPSNIVEKSELVSLVEEAEKQRAVRSSGPSHAWAATSGTRTEGRVLKVDLPPPWAQRESRSMPGRFYFVHQDTGERTWEPWFEQESRSSPGRFYFINVLTGESTWEPPTQRWKDLAAERAQERLMKAQGPAPPPPPPPPPPVVPPLEGPIEEAEPPEPHSEDYRDEAFMDGNRISGGSSSRPKSVRRDSVVLSCEHSTRGVRALAIGPTVDDWEKSMSTVRDGPMPDVPDLVKGQDLDWVKGPLIGRGSLGRVFKAVDTRTGKVIAVKEVAINYHDKRDMKFKEALENEVTIMKGLHHTNIVAYLGHDYMHECLYMYLEHMPGGTITQALNEFGPFAECLMADYSKQVLQGLEYLHTRDPAVIHRDIKGSNILIGDGATAKLADFGCSKRTDETLTHTMRGSIPWMAPEVLAHSRYGRAADIWSFGCVVIEMGTASVPWGKFDHHMAALVKIGLSQEIPPFPDNVTEDCKDFISKCVKREPDERFSATEMLNHSWLSKNFAEE